MNFPENLRYTKDHEWIRVLEDGKTALIGITDFAQHELGDIVYVEIQPVGTELRKGDPLGTVEAVKTVADVYMPVSGKILEFNEKLQDHPELINQDPYGEGWIARIEMTHPEELDELLSAEEYQAMIA